MKVHITTIAVIGMLLMSTGCDVSDPIYNTPHPDHGKIILTTHWADRSEGVEIPGNYTVQVGSYQTQGIGTTLVLDHLFEADTYPVHIYNEPEQITVSGTVARVNPISGRAGESDGPFIHPLPGWFFACATEVSIEKDSEHALTASMRQQVRQLSLGVELEGVQPEQILSLEGWLTGVAGQLDIDNGQHGNPSEVSMDFARITEGSQAGKWAVTVRLLGISGAEQNLHIRIRMAGSASYVLEVESDLSVALSDFNNDKKSPVGLNTRMVIVPDVEAGFTATIEPWKQGEGGSGIAT